MAKQTKKTRTPKSAPKTSTKDIDVKAEEVSPKFKSKDVEELIAEKDLRINELEAQLAQAISDLNEAQKPAAKAPTANLEGELANEKQKAIDADVKRKRTEQELREVKKKLKIALSKIVSEFNL